MRRTPVTVAIACIWLLAAASPATAHGSGGLASTNYLTRLRTVTPAVPGVTMRVVEAGSRFQLRNDSATDLVVLGYQDEPYLRIGPRGVFENRRSPATYLNAARRDADITVPGDTDPEAPPVWRRTSSDPVARWHDHRIHWMGERDPPAVRRAPDRRHVVIPDWVIPMRVADRAVEARGDLLWVPGPSPVPWLALAGGLLLLAILAAWTRARWIALAVLLVVLVGSDVAHAVGVGFAKAGGTGTRVTTVLAGSFYAVVGWAAGLLGAWLLVHRRREGLHAAVVAGVVVALFGGVADASDLVRSQVPFAWGASAARLLASTALGLGSGTALGAFLALRRVPAAADAPAAPG